jgi:hypothetical protein
VAGIFKTNCVSANKAHRHTRTKRQQSFIYNANT